MIEFPQMLYRHPGTQWVIDGERYDLMTVKSEGERVAALADGWHLTAEGAHGQKAEPPKQAAAPADGDAEPFTRADLESMAEAAGLKVDKRWSDATLAAKLKGA